MNVYVTWARPAMRSALMPAIIVTALSPWSTSVMAEPSDYTLDASHSQVLFSYNHLGFSTTYNLFSGFEGDIKFDPEKPESSSVSVTIPVMSMFTGWEKRFTHFMSEEFFGATEDDMITFTSTSIEVTGEGTALITGDLTMNDVTKSVVLDAQLNKSDNHPMANKDWLGFDATTTLIRSDFNLGIAAPAVSDEVEVKISIEASKAG